MIGEHRDDRRGEEPERVVVRDRRRIDPLTGAVRAPGDGRAAASTGPGAPDEEGEISVEAHDVVPDPSEAKLAELTAQLDERTADLQRVSAEYANYRRRVDRDREVAALAARAQVAGELLTVLDDVARADAHGDLTGAFKVVADKLVAAVKHVGLEPFGVAGEPFDPAVHEAVQHTTSADVTGPTVSLVMRQGYRLGDRVLRPAMVAVSDVDPTAMAPDPPPAGFVDDSTGPLGDGPAS